MMMLIRALFSEMCWTTDIQICYMLLTWSFLSLAAAKIEAYVLLYMQPDCHSAIH